MADNKNIGIKNLPQVGEIKEGDFLLVEAELTVQEFEEAGVFLENPSWLVSCTVDRLSVRMKIENQGFQKQKWQDKVDYFDRYSPWLKSLIN